MLGCLTLDTIFKILRVIIINSSCVPDLVLLSLKFRGDVYHSCFLKKLYCFLSLSPPEALGGGV